MGRRRTIRSLDQEIAVLQDKVVKTKARYDAQCKRLSDLEAQRDQIIAQDIWAAIKRSGRSYSEVMTFLGRQPR